MTNEIVTMDEKQLKQIETLSSDMANTGLAIPKHLQGNPAACKAVVRNSIRWSMDPYLVAAESSDIKGKLMYSGKLVNAVVSEDPRLEFPLDFEFSGQGEQMVCSVIGKLKGEGKERRVNVPMPPQNKRISDHWKSNQEQQLSYYAVRVWARRHLPGKLLGVWTPDDPTAAAYHPQKETNSVIDNVIRTANDEETVDEDVIEGVAVEVEDVTDEGEIIPPAIRLIKSNGDQVDFDNFQSWLDFITTNIPKIKDITHLETFEANHAPIFDEYVKDGWEEWVVKANEIIQINKDRLESDDGNL